MLFTRLVAGGVTKNTTNDAYHVAWNEQNVAFRWATPSFSNPLGNQYYYLLKGVDKDWQYAGNKGLATYNNLAPGAYTFIYKATNADGRMTPESSITLIVEPPFWQTLWFRGLCLVIIGSGFFYAVRYISQRNLKERLLTLEKEQAVERERNRISRDMHDELGSGLTKIAILTEVTKTQAGQTTVTLDKISETARVLVDNLDEMVWALNPKNDSLDKLAAYIAEYANRFLEGTNIDCIVSLPDDIPAISITEEKRRNIFMTAKEFLNNTVKHSHASLATIEVKAQQGLFTITLTDNGRGFDTVYSGGTGNGLNNMKQRIADIGGKATLSSSANGTFLGISCPI
ncbi:MAG: hypothetical protein JSS82_00485 [Bacteroidetes bacterium]|nr:hypothetical protein [Bacteroidota bacterium]